LRYHRNTSKKKFTNSTWANWTVTWEHNESVLEVKN
jgi:hypothetical protein